VGWRYYDPASGRFLQRDPIGIRGGLNVYEYVDSNPLTSIDPSGCGLKEVLEGLRRLLPKWGGAGAAGTIAGCGGIFLMVADRIIKPAIDRRNRRIERVGDPRFRRPFNPKDPWDWAEGTRWERQRKKWRRKHLPPGPGPREVPVPDCMTHTM
jgi:uncharacterized protein RhaS with RHS repeats